MIYTSKTTERRTSHLHFLCQSGADTVKSGKPIAQNGGHPVLDRVEPAVKIYLGLKIALYTVFRI